MNAHRPSCQRSNIKARSGWPSGSRRGFVTVCLLVLSLVLVVPAQFALAQNAPPPPSAEGLTQDLVALQARLQRARPAEQVQLLSTLTRLAVARQQLLAQLVEEHPEEVLRVAIPAYLRASMPPAVQTYVEEQVDVEGNLEVLHEDRDHGSRFLYFLHAAGKRFSLHFVAEPPDVLTDTRVRASGLRVGEALALESGSTNLQTLTTVMPNTFGVQKTLVILVNFQDKATQPYTLDYARNVVFNTTSGFYWENSYQQTQLAGDVVGWYTLPLSYTTCNSSSIATYAKQAATAAGVNLSLYTRYVYAFPSNACTWWGLGSVGGNPSQAWVNGSFQLAVVGHELGHNFGLRHSHSMDCGATAIGSNCTTNDYGDTLDIMGNSSSAHFNAFQKDRLGWLDYNVSPPITSVQTSGTYTIAPYEPLGSTAKALSVVKSIDPQTGNRTWYYIEYRQAIGFDSFLSSNNNVTKGVVIHTGSAASSNSSYLLDMTPETTSWSDPALVVGKSFYDADAGVTIAPVSVGASGATVSVSFGPLACVRADPSIALSPSQTQWGQPGSPVTYTITVTNNDNTGCTASSFLLESLVPSGWAADFVTAVLSISPGASASTTLQVTSPASATDGFYDLEVIATNSTDAAATASTWATVVLMASLDVTAATDKSSYPTNTSVSLTANVRADGAPVANASVIFTITKATGAVMQQTATTGANGTAVSQFRLKKNDPLGTYQVVAAASVNGISGSDSTSFTVTK